MLICSGDQSYWVNFLLSQVHRDSAPALMDVYFVLPCSSDANGAEEQIYQEFGYSVFVYWAQMSQFLCSLRCYA